MRHITVRFDDGDTLDTEINGTNLEIATHYLGQTFEVNDDKHHHKAVVVEFNDTLTVEGVWAVSIESGWLGMVIDVEPTQGGDCEGFMFKMVGVCDLSMIVGGLTKEEAISMDDIQWFDPRDLRFFKSKPQESPTCQ